MDTTQIDSIQFDHVVLRPGSKERMIKEVITFLNNHDDIIPKLDEYLCGEYPPSKKDETIINLYGDLMNIFHRSGIRVNYTEHQNRNNSNCIPFDRYYFFDLLTAKFRSEGIDMEMYFVEDEHISIDKNEIFLERYDFEKKEYEMGIIFSRYEGYLTMEILPQITFAFVLLCVTAFALIFTYRGYIKQVRLNVLRSDFINNITHELKIPVATAKAALEALRSFGMKADAKITEEYLEMVSKEMSRLDSLTSKVLEHAKMEGQRNNLKLVETDLTAFSESITKSMNVLLNSIGADVSFVSPQTPVMVHIDKVYVEGVIKNLMDNSVKYAGDNVTIQLVLWQDENNAYISVNDNGPGIPKEYVSKVFDKFFRVPNGDKHNVKGYGLGLSFAYLVMQQHHGSIKAENLKDGGCRFTLRFPLEQVI
jgi:signal transduction histidine kinase